MSDSSPPSSPLSLSRKLGFSLLATVLFLLVLEGFFRLPPLSRPIQLFLDDRSHARDMVELTEKANFHVPDPVVLWRMRPHVHLPWGKGEMTGTWGFRHGDPRPLRQGGLRVLSMGDSTCFGWGVLGNETYSALLEDALLPHYGSDGVQVINAGVPGYTTWQGKRRLAELLPLLRPKVVITYFGTNDMAAAMMEDEERGRVLVLQQLLRGSALYNALLAGFRRVITPPHIDAADPRQMVALYDHPRVTPEDFEKNIKEMEDLCARHGATMVEIIPVRLNNERLLHVDANVVTGSYRVEPEPLFQAEVAKGVPVEALFVDNDHFTLGGHGIVARMVYQNLMTRGVVAPLKEGSPVQ